VQKPKPRRKYKVDFSSSLTDAKLSGIYKTVHKWTKLQADVRESERENRKAYLKERIAEMEKEEATVEPMEHSS
jgi:hypothetical protein